MFIGICLNKTLSWPSLWAHFVHLGFLKSHFVYWVDCGSTVTFYDNFCSATWAVYWKSCSLFNVKCLFLKKQFEDEVTPYDQISRMVCHFRHCLERVHFYLYLTPEPSKKLRIFSLFGSVFLYSLPTEISVSNQISISSALDCCCLCLPNPLVASFVFEVNWPCE